MNTAVDLRLRDLLDIYFAGIGEVEEQREVAGGRTWRASLLGSCMRRQYLELKERRPKDRAIDARTQRIFQVGHLTGVLIANAFRKLGVLLEEELPMHDEEWDIGAHVDFIVGGEIQDAPVGDLLAQVVRARVLREYGPELPIIGVELKSKSSRSFHYAKKNGGVVAGDNQLIQAATYDLMARKHGIHVDRWAVLSIAKDDLTMAEDPVEGWHRVAALSRLAMLNSAKRAEDLPCSCLTDYNGKGWKFCPYGVDEWTCC